MLRGQIDNLYAAKKVENGRVLVPHYYGDAGWYGYHDVDKSSPGLGNRRRVETDVYLWSLKASDLERLPKTGWIGFLEGKDRAYPLPGVPGRTRRGAARGPAVARGHEHRGLSSG